MDMTCPAPQTADPLARLVTSSQAVFSSGAPPEEAAPARCAVFDGAAFVERVPFPEARRYLVAFLDKLNRATRASNGAPTNLLHLPRSP